MNIQEMTKDQQAFLLDVIHDSSLQRKLIDDNDERAFIIFDSKAQHKLFDCFFASKGQHDLVWSLI